MDCLFCKIVTGEIPCHRIWENEEYLAFLTIFPNTPGFSVVIPKKHYDSYAFAVPEDVLLGLVSAARTVGLLIDDAFEDVGRTGLLFEGFGVNHLHAKLFPMHGTKPQDGWRPITSENKKFFEKYEGYMSSHDAARADDAELAAIARKIRGQL